MCEEECWYQVSSFFTLFEVIILTYGIVCREQATQIQSEYRFSWRTLADWGMFCREVMLVYMERSSVKIGGPSKLTRVSSVGESIIGVTLLRVSGCLAV